MSANPQKINQLLLKKSIPLVFFSLMLLSLFFEESIGWMILFFALCKSLIGTIFYWFFFMVLGEVIIKSILWSVADDSHQREEGGILFHFLKPQPDELTEEGVANTEKDEKSKKPQNSVK